MAKSQPKSVENVVSVMKEYVSKKKYNLTETQIEYLAEDCFLFFSAKGWNNTAFWPALAMRWVLNNVNKFGDNVEEKEHIEPKQEGPTIRDKILKDVQSQDQF